MPAPVRLEITMAKPNHLRRTRPKPPPARARRLAQLHQADRQSRRKIERWRRGW
jgi:hypothetical protein